MPSKKPEGDVSRFSGGGKETIFALGISWSTPVWGGSTKPPERRRPLSTEGGKRSRTGQRSGKE